MFNWVHTKFHYNPLKGGNASRKKGESIRKGIKTQGLLGKQVDEFVDDWKINNGRRLTILFMGFEKSSKPRNYFNLRKEGKRDNDEDDIIIVDNDVDEEDDIDELTPLMATTFQTNFDNNNGEFCTEFEKSQVVVAIQRHVAQRIRRRVTLADLFMEDAHGNKPKPAPENGQEPDFRKKLPEVETNIDSCFSEKPKVGPEPPARNLRRVMGKMMKKKMHAKVHNEQLLGENKLYGKVIDPTSLPIPAACA
ncbi:protein TILLER ANGLE CONTROL 1-like [Benincasa hispida]|uniref:protein TILLER ANGLE CONTROL 1-like n=1 Tax=Benincasa hispida TaxID=102211 RepID=UPI001902821B|nr:protein TILLER ANGLE CONTROL 1-like [Benincasa hispida]XP_038903827.1 protein TILLER ANGLE CONTROL 1-like [Benincasa hispida]